MTQHESQKISNGVNLSAILETILFAYGEPLSVERLVKITKAKKEEVTAGIHALEERLKESGLVLVKKDGAYELGSRPEYASYLEALMKDELTEELSRAALETVSIIAYKGPITRARIEYIRGVNSSFTLRNLLMRGLIERIENPKDARSYLYRISFDFLKHFGLTTIEELPEYEKFKQETIEILEEK